MMWAPLCIRKPNERRRAAFPQARSSAHRQLAGRSTCTVESFSGVWPASHPQGLDFCLSPHTLLALLLRGTLANTKSGESRHSEGTARNQRPCRKRLLQAGSPELQAQVWEAEHTEIEQWREQRAWELLLDALSAHLDQPRKLGKA